MSEEATKSESPVKPGDVLGGKFRIERVLGIGGMGVVCAATHLQLGQLVALKFMLPQALQFPQNVARFEREARNAVRLKSDHVAKVTDVGTLDDGAPYMVMEFLEGLDLDEYVQQQGPLPITTAVDFLLQACEAISEAHSLGIVHRDLKPKNLFLTSKLGGRSIVKVLDFGISKQLGVTEDMSLTSTSHVIGSPNYMSPEQLRASKDVDHRTDIWALGAILFELLTAQVPFPADTVTQLTAMVIADEPQAIEKLRPDVPEEIRAVVRKCLEKKRDDRFATVADLMMALSPFSSQASQSGAHASSSGSFFPPSPSVAPPAERSSHRAMGGSTSVAWDKTQLADTGAPPPAAPRSRAPLVIAVLAIAGALAVGGFFALHKTPSPETPATAGGGPSVTLPSAVDTPTVPDPHMPLATATGGPVALPSATGASTRPTNHAGVVTPPVAKPDAGVVAPPPTQVPSAAGSHKPDDLPSTRN